MFDVYALPYDASCPISCLDEKPYQLLDERHESLPMMAGSAQKLIVSMSGWVRARFLLCVNL